MPTSRTLQTTRYGKSSSSRYLYGRGVPGSMRYYRGTAIGRDTPLYLRPRYSHTEAHVVQTPQAAFYLNATGGIGQINVVDQGDALSNRLATRIYMKDLMFRFAMTNLSQGTSSCTFAIVYDRQPLGVLPAISDIFDAPNVQSFQRLDTRDRFQVLYRKDMSFDGNSTMPTPSMGQILTAVVPIGRSTTYTVGVASGAIANVKTGALYFVYFGTGVSTNDTVIGSGTFRLVFSP